MFLDAERRDHSAARQQQGWDAQARLPGFSYHAKASPHCCVRRKAGQLLASPSQHHWEQMLPDSSPKGPKATLSLDCVTMLPHTGCTASVFSVLGTQSFQTPHLKIKMQLEANGLMEKPADEGPSSLALCVPDMRPSVPGCSSEAEPHASPLTSELDQNGLEQERGQAEWRVYTSGNRLALSLVPG